MFLIFNRFYGLCVRIAVCRFVAVNCRQATACIYWNPFPPPPLHFHWPGAANSNETILNVTQYVRANLNHRKQRWCMMSTWNLWAQLMLSAFFIEELGCVYYFIFTELTYHNFDMLLGQPLHTEEFCDIDEWKMLFQWSKLNTLWDLINWTTIKRINFKPFRSISILHLFFFSSKVHVTTTLNESSSNKCLLLWTMVRPILHFNYNGYHVTSFMIQCHLVW